MTVLLKQCTSTAYLRIGSDRRRIQLLSTDVPLDDFLGRSPEERHADPDRLSTISGNSHEDSQSTISQPQNGQTGLVSFAQYLLSEDPDLQQELEQTHADLNSYIEPVDSDFG